MFRISFLLPIALLALIGCSSETDTGNDPSIATTFVSLKVPNMV